MTLLVFAFAVFCFVVGQALKKPAQFVALTVGVVTLAAATGIATWLEVLT